MQSPTERAEYLELLEKSLRASILFKENNKETKKLIKMPNMNLSKRDENGRSFLAIALEAGNEEIATLLFNMQKNDDAIIYGVDVKGRNLFSLAQGLPQKPSPDSIDGIPHKPVPNFIDLLLEHAKINGKKPWLSFDKDGNSSLFAAVRSLNPDTVQRILDLFIQEANFRELIDHNLDNGDTALHLACQMKALKVIVQLINTGANFNLHNNDRLSFFSLFSNFSRLEQQTVFLLLTREKKEEFLAKYFHYLNGKIEADHHVYVLAGLNSLQTLVCTHLQFSKKTKSRQTYIHTKGDKEGNIEISEFVIPEGMLSKIPLYAKRIDLIVDLAPITKINSSYLEVIDEDRSSLLELRNDINNLLQNLRNRNLLSWQMKLTIRFSLPFLFISFFVSLFCLLVGAFLVGARFGYFKLMLSGGAGLIATVLALGVYVIFLNSRLALMTNLYRNPESLAEREPAVSITVTKSEWQEFIPKLSHLKNKLKENTGGITFSNNELVNDLDNVLLSLAVDQPIIISIRLFTSINNMLIEIVNDMNKTKKPLSLYFKSALKSEARKKESTIIEILEDITVDDEEPHALPLLRRVS